MGKDDYLETLAEVPLFADLDKKELRTISQLMTQIRVESGRVLTAEGTAGREFIVIVSGSAEVTKGDEVIATLVDGDFLGELALITGQPRNATVTTTSDTDLMVLNRREMMALLDDTPRIARKILVAAVSRLSPEE